MGEGDTTTSVTGETVPSAISYGIGDSTDNTASEVARMQAGMYGQGYQFPSASGGVEPGTYGPRMTDSQQAIAGAIPIIGPFLKAYGAQNVYSAGGAGWQGTDSDLASKYGTGSTSGSSSGIGTGTLGAALGLAGALTSGGSGSYTPNPADPFGQYRAGLAQQYGEYFTQGNQPDITKMPGYSQYKSGVVDPAMSTAMASNAARGMSYSGAEQAQLQKIGQQGYYGFMTDYLNRLAQGSGAGASPLAAAQFAAQQQQAQQDATMGWLGAGANWLLGGGFNKLSNLFTGSGSTSGAGGYSGGFVPSWGYGGEAYNPLNPVGY